VPAAAQFIERVATLAEEVAAIEVDERALNEVLYGLYRLGQRSGILWRTSSGGATC
jgi:hypothetical protein